jgi:hypothetical protein
MKKALVFIEWYLPGYKAGGPIRSMANMIAALKSEISFYVVCGDTDYLDKEPYQQVKSDEWNKLSENEFVYYVSKEACNPGLIKRLMRNTEFDILYINGVYSLYYSIIPLIMAKWLKGKEIILAPRGMLSNQAFSAKKIKKKAFVWFARKSGLYSHSIIHTTSQAESSDILQLKLNPKAICHLPNLPPFVITKNTRKINKQAGEISLVNIARISPEKNTLFSLECLANFVYSGKIRYHLFGSVYNKPYWEKCLELIRKMPENIDVSYHGALEYSRVHEILSENHFLFLPTLGENFGHSILEAFLAGSPVIISNKTPWLNLQANKLGWDLDLSHELFAHAIQEAIHLDNNTYSELSVSCQKFAAQKLEIKELVGQYLNFFSGNA